MFALLSFYFFLNREIYMCYSEENRAKRIKMNMALCISSYFLQGAYFFQIAKFTCTNMTWSYGFRV